MSGGNVTECPSCSTRFRVGDAQLEAAAGQVRCGSCLNVFQARDYLVPDFGDDVVDISNAPKLEGTLSEEFLALSNTRWRGPVAPDEAEQDSGAGESEGDEEPQDLDAEPEDTVPHAFRERTTAEYRRVSVLRAEETTKVDEERRAQEKSEITEEATLDGIEVPNLAEFGFDSAEFEQPGVWWRRKWFYAVGASLLLLLFVGQFLYGQASSLSAESGMRPFYRSFCAVFGCTVAEIREPHRIRSRQVVVRSHPEAADAIVVEAVIFNDAPYGQAFPDVEIQFSDMNGRPVASRRFAPEEYLSGELAGQVEMPSRTPIRIALELVDPGRDAVNYVVLFH
jgi:predicted Zn finger-like uncharacterized protein